MNDDDIGRVIYRLVSLGGMYQEDIEDLESWLKQNGLTKNEIAVIKDQINILGANIKWQRCEESLRTIVQGRYPVGTNNLDLLRSLFVFEHLQN